MARLRQIPAKVDVAVGRVMQSSEWVNELRGIAVLTIESKVPPSHKYLVTALRKFIDHDTSTGVMRFWIDNPMSDIHRWREETTPQQANQFVRDIEWKDVFDWVVNFKEITEDDARVSEFGQPDYKAITDAVMEAKKLHPEDWTNPNRKETSLIASQGFYGATLTDNSVVAEVLRAVLVEWRDYVHKNIGKRVAAAIRTELASGAEPF